MADTGLMTTTNATVEVLDVIKAPNGHIYIQLMLMNISLNDAVRHKYCDARLALRKTIQRLTFYIKH